MILFVHAKKIDLPRQNVVYRRHDARTEKTLYQDVWLPDERL